LFSGLRKLGLALRIPAVDNERKDLHSEAPVEPLAIQRMIELLYHRDLHLEEVHAVTVTRDNLGVEIVTQEACRLAVLDYPGDESDQPVPLLY
jgi:hypothetical protein